jgi:hypothetical protein
LKICNLNNWHTAKNYDKCVNSHFFLWLSDFVHVHVHVFPIHGHVHNVHVYVHVHFYVHFLVHVNLFAPAASGIENSGNWHTAKNEFLWGAN